ncbi:hypothetical protein MASR2M66_06580 [Chloroflexota bacterium]
MPFQKHTGEIACSLRPHCPARHRTDFVAGISAHYACLGREKEVSDLTSEASADLSDFLTLSYEGN